MRAASVTRAMHPKISSEAEVDCTRVVIAAVRAVCSPRDKSGPKMMLFRRPLFQIIKTYGDKPRSRRLMSPSLLQIPGGEPVKKADLCCAVIETTIATYG